MIKLFCISGLVSFSALGVFAQDTLTKARVIGARLLYGPEYRKPEYCGGDSILHKFVTTHGFFPVAAREAGVQGRVAVSFLVDEFGNCSKFKVTRGIGLGCDSEALRLIQDMPSWEPATYRGKPVRAIQNVPLIFKLE